MAGGSWDAAGRVNAGAGGGGEPGQGADQVVKIGAAQLVAVAAALRAGGHQPGGAQPRQVVGDQRLAQASVILQVPH